MVLVERAAEAAPQAGSTVSVLLVFSPGPRQVLQLQLKLPPGSTVRQALQASGWLDQVEGLSLAALASGAITCGVWGRRAAAGQALRDGDRLELYRGLRVDPKEARRLRYRAHGEKIPKGIQRSKKPSAN